jgi:hypothetical protein
MSKATTTKSTTAKASANEETPKRRTNKTVTSAKMMELYQTAVETKMSYSELLFEVKATGSYGSTEQAVDRLHRFKSYVRKKYDCELQALPGTPRLPSNRKALLDNYSCLVKR